MLLVKDQPGVMQRITSLFTRRGFNMESITVGSSEEEGLSRIIIVTVCDENLINQLLKLVDVCEAKILNSERMTISELAFIKVSTETNKDRGLENIVESFGAAVVHTSAKTMIIRAVDETGMINDLIEQVSPYGICELTRTGAVAMEQDNH